MGSNGFLFLGILIFIFILWVVTGGPTRPISFSGPYVTPITRPGDVAEPYDLKRGTGSSSGLPRGSFSDLTTQINDLASVGETSKYRGIVTLGRNTSGPRATTAAEEHLTIQVSRRLGDETVTLSGWTLISSATEQGATIPLGVEVPRSGSVNRLAPIVLVAGETIVVTTGRSPVGVSFRENLCTGYLGEFQEFSPPLGKMCPLARDEFERTYSDQGDEECIMYLRQIPRCETQAAPTAKDLDEKCNDFIEDLNYNSCVVAHGSEAGFYSDTWRVFLGKGRELWRENHETIRLLDAEGKTVDVLAY